MAQLFNREIFLNVGGTLIRSRFDEEDRVLPTLRVGFNIEKTLKRTPNKAEITITNLKEDNRVKIQEKDIGVILEAGYVGQTHQIFKGNLEFGQNRLIGREWISTIQTKDGGQAFRRSRVSKSFKRPAKVGDVFEFMAGQLGVDKGNIREKLSSLRGGLSEWSSGIVLSGKSEKQFDKLARSMGFTWSVQDGALLLLGPKETIGTNAAVLSSTTGMIGAPEPGEKGFVKVQALIQPDLIPGRAVEIRSRNDRLNGFYRIDKAVYVGDTWGGEWTVNIEGKPLN